MSRKLSIIIFFIFLIIGGAVGYLYFRSSGTGNREQGTSVLNSGNGGFPTGGSVDSGRSSETGVRSVGNSTSTSSELRATGSNGFLSTNTTNGILKQIVNVPVGGATVYTDARGQVTVRYIERESGHVQDQPINEKVPSKITDTTIPKIIEAIWGKDGKFLVLQALNGKDNPLSTAFAEIKKASAPAAATTTTQFLGDPNLSTVVGSLDGTLLPSTVHIAVASPDKTTYLYLNETANGAVAVIVPGDKAKLSKSLATVFSSPLTEWTPAWPTKDTVTFTARAGSNLPGFMYKVNIGTKQKTLLLKDIPGLLTNMSPDGQKVLYTENSGTGFITKMYDTKTGAVATFPLRTLPEKCLWSKKSTVVIYCAAPASLRAGVYPDDWYIGTIGFNDAIWRVNIQTGETKQILPASSSQASAQDAVKLFSDEKEQNLFWTNKRDLTIWGIALGS